MSPRTKLILCATHLTVAVCALAAGRLWQLSTVDKPRTLPDLADRARAAGLAVHTGSAHHQPGRVCYFAVKNLTPDDIANLAKPTPPPGVCWAAADGEHATLAAGAGTVRRGPFTFGGDAEVIARLLELLRD